MVKQTEKKLFAGKPGPGRPKGSTNKATAALKDMILASLDKVGGEAYLVAQAEANPTAFLTLIGKVLPLQVNAEHDLTKRAAKALAWKPPT